MDTPQQPAYPMHQLTTFELRDYRKQLEHAVERLGSAPVVQDLQQKLRQVLDEEDSRARFRAGNGQ
jgi:hypothetical protein